MDLSICINNACLVIRGNTATNFQKATITIDRGIPEHLVTEVSVQNGELLFEVNQEQLIDIRSVQVTLEDIDGYNATYDLEDPGDLAENWIPLKLQDDQNSTGGLECGPTGCPPG